MIELQKRVTESRTSYKIYNADCEFCISVNDQTQKHRLLILDLNARNKELEKGLVDALDIAEQNEEDPDTVLIDHIKKVLFKKLEL